MKYVLLTPIFLLFIMLAMISIIIGVINFCWDFKKKSYHKGVQWLDKKINFCYYADKILK